MRITNISRGLALFAGGLFCGFLTGGMYAANLYEGELKKVKVYKVIPPDPVPAANILTCPPTKKTIEEYYRTCRHKRNSL